ncbi:MAG: DMT family transporter [Pseudomonadota bacterium]
MPVSVLPALALLLNAFVWGVSWWPFRILEGHGLHPLWSTAAVYAFALACLLCWRPGALWVLLRQPALWPLAAAAGITNVCFNWGVTQGDVVRVVLLFYLMPVWTAVLAWPLLGEKPSLATLGRMALALAGVVVVLKTPEAPWPVPQSLPDWLGVAGGLSFSFTNILLLRLRATPDTARTMAMFCGGCLAALAAGCLGMAAGLVPALPAPSVLGGAGAGTAVLLALGFLMGNVALQYGAARLPANVTSLVMLSEVVFASASAVVLGASGLAPHTVVGGLMVLAAAAWSALAPAKHEAG